jgi:hypothetical protein
MISPWDYKMLEKSKLNIYSHKLANQIVWPGNSTKDKYHEGVHFETAKKSMYHEFHINWEHYVPEIGNIQCKSLLDGLTLDFKNKKAIIYDLKTTQKLWHFEDSIDQYDYLRQLCYYRMAVMWYLENECDEDHMEIINTWQFEYYIIGIDTTGSNEIRVFKVEPFMVDSREHTIRVVLTDIGWHQMNDKWDHSREYYEGDGSENLNL